MASFKSFYRSVLIAGIALSTALGVSSSAWAVTYTGGAGTKADPAWSVTVDPGITLIESVLYTSATSPSSPANQGYNSGTGHLLDWIQNTAGFSGAGLVANGQVSSTSFTGTTADLFGVHFGCGKIGPCELVWLFSGDTTFKVNFLHGFSNISAFSNAAATPLPGGLPLLATGLGALGLLGWLRRKKAAASNATTFAL